MPRPTSRFIPSTLLLLCLGASIALLSSCQPKAESKSTATTSETVRADALRELVGGPTKLVWTRTLEGAHGDVFLRGDGHQIIAYDTETAVERILVDDLGNYQRPLLTPDGETVVYTDYLGGSVYSIDWAGQTEPRLLLSGGILALDVVADPETGVPVVLAGGGLRNDGGLMFADEVIRFELSDPVGTQRVVWEETPVSIDGFHGGDLGRSFVANTPWPTIGLADLEDGESWKKAGQGCWPSLAPSDSGLLWIFDGSHQKVSVFSPAARKKWSLRLDTHPTLTGHEVYHPKWTSSPRHVVLTGPYVHDNGAGYGKIGAGGTGVEIWVGRLAADLSSVEAWHQVTDNASGDFMPSLWTQATTTLDLDQVHVGKPDGAMVSDIAAEGWRLADRGLVYVWENRGTRNEIARQEASTLACDLRPIGTARYAPALQLEIGAGSAVDSGETLAHAITNISQSNEITVELVLDVEKSPVTPSELLTLGGPSKDNPNFRLGLLGESLFLSCRGLQGGDNHNAPLSMAGKITPGSPQHLVFTLGKDHIRFYLNGVLATQSGGFPTQFGGWQGDSLRIGPGLHSRVGQLAIYSTALDENAVYAKSEAVSKPLEMWAQTQTATKIEAALVKAATLPQSGDLGVYRRGLVVQEYQRPSGSSFPHERFLVAHWAILDRRPVTNVPQSQSAPIKLSIEPYEAHPELEGEWTAPYEDTGLPLFFDVAEPQFSDP